MPEIGGRYQSMHVVKQDNYMYVEATPGTYRLTEDKVGTRFAAVSFRTFGDTNDPEDMKAARAAQARSRRQTGIQKTWRLRATH